MVVATVPLAPSPALAAPDAISVENAKTGNPPSEWDVAGAGDLTIQGFTNDISYVEGDSVQFRVGNPAGGSELDPVAPADFSIQIYRLGYYAGDGARLVATIDATATTESDPPACLTQATTGLIDCGNWPVAATWTVPADITSGVFIARLERVDTGGASHVPFVIRDDTSGSDILFQTSDTTWHAYNQYGGNSLYTGSGPGTGGNADGRAYAVSYNRPITTRGTSAEDALFNAEYPMIRWLERNGYDVSYTTGIDSDRRGAEILEHQVFMSVGHDEYWSGPQRSAVEAARDAGVHLAFFSSNEIFWRTRLTSSLGTPVPNRTLVSYKETHDYPNNADPTNEWTGTWRDPRDADSVNLPENGLSGTMFTVNCCSYPMTVPAEDGNLRLWRNSSVAASGGDDTLGSSIVGYEWDEDVDNGSRPAGQIRLSSTTTNVSQKVVESSYGSEFSDGVATHAVTMHRAASGALVFGSGTLQWSWGLDDEHDRGADPVIPAIQQATVNLLADMGVQPATLQAGLTAASASGDSTEPSSMITTPTNGTTIPSGKIVTVTGTATDIGGVVGGVEVSVDGGTTWRRANGRSAWTFTFVAPSSGGVTVDIVSRATDDSLNTETPGTPVSVLTQDPVPFPDNGPGGPILVVTDAGSSNPFGRYLGDILLAEGLNAYAIADIATLDAATLSRYATVILAETTVDAADVTLLTNWVTAGGNLIAMRPDASLAPLLGLTPSGGTLAEGYLLVDTAAGPGTGIVGETLRYHGTADLYTLNGATEVARLYSSAGTATASPAVTLNEVGGSGGQAAAFTYDLARSVVLTRQGNPAWAGTNGDGSPGPVRADDMFHNGTDPDWVDLDKVQIPQADEQQRLLANLLTTMTLDKLPLPRMWYFPRGERAVVVMTMDEHGGGNLTGRLDDYLAADPAGCSVEDWECVRSTSYIYTNAPITDAQIAAYRAQGFEFAVHIDTGCADFTPASLATNYANQIAGLESQFPSIDPPRTQRSHCIVWSDWASQPLTQEASGIKLDTNYYYWPEAWIQDRPGLFTGSGIPMRFADQDGTLIDVYQATTQMTDESGQAFPATIDALLNNAIGSPGFYGAFVANPHTDGGANASQIASAIISSAQSKGVPIVSAEQLLEWVDGRYTSEFENLNWNGSTLEFSVTIGVGARGLQTMVPVRSTSGELTQIQLNATPVSFSRSIIKGVEYAMFTAAPGTYSVTYGSDSTPPTVSTTSPAGGAVNVAVTAPVTASFSEPVDPATVNGTNFVLTGPGGPVGATVTYVAGTSTAVLTPSGQLTEGATYTAAIANVADLSGNVMPSATTWAFTTASCPCTIWGDTPGGSSYNDSQPIETGVRFRSSDDGQITAIRFYKSATAGTDFTGSLWTNGGTLLGSGSVTLPAGVTGWQEIPLATPVAINANTTYVASHFSVTGDYTATIGGLATGVDSPPLRALADGEDGANGLFLIGGGFPTSTFGSNNYWVDVVFSVPDATPPTIVVRSPAPGASGVPTTGVVSVTFSEPMDGASITNATFRLQANGATADVAATVTTTGAVSVLTPAAALDASTTYMVTVSGSVTDLAGNPLGADSSWGFTTAAAGGGGGGGGGGGIIVAQDACPPSSTASFTDLDGLSPEAQDAISCLVLYGISQGTSPETFDPYDAVSRWQMALFLTRQLTVHGVALPAAADAGFDDIGTLPATTQDAINQLAALGITTGTTATVFDPEAYVTRWQMALFLARFAKEVGIDLETAPVASFSDLGGFPDATRLAIDQLAAAGIAKGTSATTFDPTADVERWQMALFLTRVLQAGNVTPE